MKKTYFKDRKAAIEDYKGLSDMEILTEEKLATLPSPIQKYFRLCGYVNNPLAMNADVIWKESFIKLKPGQKWRVLKTLQFNSVNPIMRTSYMRVKSMFFAGKDLYSYGKGTMMGTILNLIPVINAKGPEISQSSLITSFCEMMMLSGYAFQDYIQWKEIDQCTVKGRLTDYDFEVSGIFHFDMDGKFKYFESDDRFFDNGDGTFVKKKFIAQVHSHKWVGDILQPEKVSVLWVLEKGMYEYFKGTIERINYNVTDSSKN